MVVARCIHLASLQINLYVSDCRSTMDIQKNKGRNSAYTGRTERVPELDGRKLG